MANCNWTMENSGVTDSLMGVEFGLSLEQMLGDNVPVSLISDTLSIDQIASNLVGHLKSGAAKVEQVDDAAQSLLAKHGAGQDPD